MTQIVQYPADRRNIAGHAGGGFVLTDQYCLDLMLRIGLQGASIAFGRSAFAPFHFEDVHVEAQASSHIAPEVTELSEAGSQNPVSGIQTVGQRRFPAPSPGRRKDDGGGGFRLEDPFQTSQDLLCQSGKFDRAMILHGDRHGAQNAVWNVGRARNEEKIMTCHGDS